MKARLRRACCVRSYLAPTERAATRERLAALDAQDIATVDRSCVEIADALDSVVAVVEQVAPSVPLDDVRPFHLGITVSVAAGWANLVGELLVRSTPSSSKGSGVT